MNDENVTVVLNLKRIEAEALYKILDKLHDFLSIVEDINYDIFDSCGSMYQLNQTLLSISNELTEVLGE